MLSKYGVALPAKPTTSAAVGGVDAAPAELPREEERDPSAPQPSAGEEADISTKTGQQSASGGENGAGRSKKEV